MELIFQTGQQEIWYCRDSLLIKFSGPRIVAGNSALNGGIQQGIETIFNHTIPKINAAGELPGGSVKAYLDLVALGLGLNPQTSSGLLTAATMGNAAYEAASFRRLEVLAAVTAGVDINGGRAGDPAAYYEEAAQFHILPGTINILLEVNVSLPPGALLQGIITATEAKTAALQELLAPSRYSTGLATGSGTDGIILVADPGSDLMLTDAGQHAKLGELIGCTVKKAVKKALALETGLSPERQLNILERLQRFNIDTEYFRQRALRLGRYANNHRDYPDLLQQLARQPELVALTSAVIHLADQVEWGLLPGGQALKVVQSMLTPSGGAQSGESISEQEPVMSLINTLVDWVNFLVSRKLSE